MVQILRYSERYNKFQRQNGSLSIKKGKKTIRSLYHKPFVQSILQIQDSRRQPSIESFKQLLRTSHNKVVQRKKNLSLG